jgi:formylglycine-generating enzyme
MRNLKVAALSVAVFIGLITAASADWPQWRGPNSSGSALPVDHVFNSWPSGGVTQLWQTASYPSYNTFGSPIAGGGRVYVIVGDNTLVCLDAADGTEVWKSGYLGAGDVHTTPCLYKGRIYATMSSGSTTLNCVNSDGSIRWAVTNLGSGVDSSPIGAGGVVVLSADDVKGFDADTGEVLWQGIPSNKTSSPGVWRKGGKEYVIINGPGRALCINAANGILVWEAPVGGDESTPAVLGDYAIVGDPATVYCLRMTETNATVVWSNALATSSSSHSIYAGYVYAAGVDGLECFELASGDLQWSVPGDSFYSSPVVGGGAVFWGPGREGSLQVMRTGPLGGTLGTISANRYSASSPAICDGKLIVHKADGSIAAFDVSSPEPMISNSGATEVTLISATLNGILWSAGKSPTAVFVHWGTNDCGATAVGWNHVQAFGVSAAGLLSTNITGLIKNATYFYRFHASNSYGNVWADVSSFVAGQILITSFNGGMELEWINGFTNGVATIEFCTNLMTGPWLPARAVLTTSGVWRTQIPNGNTPQTYYRISAADISSVPADMVLIPAGSFQMGDNFNDSLQSWGERPVHAVYVSRFYIDKRLVTKLQWDEVYNWATNRPEAVRYQFDTTGSCKRVDHPVVTLYWYDMIKWCNARSEKEGLTPAYYTSPGLTMVYRTGQVDIANDWVAWNSGGYRLPTEVEWEKAARGGVTGHRFPWSDTDTIDHTRANYYSKLPKPSYDLGYTGYDATYYDGVLPYSSPVGAFAPNGYGLYDMAGNAWEWCWDGFDKNWYSDVGATQPDTRGPAVVSVRVLRGGVSDQEAIYARCATRYSLSPALVCSCGGFRCVR